MHPIILAVEAIFITLFVLISNSRQTTHADKRAELDYGVNVRTYREINEIRTMVQALIERLDGLEAVVREGVHGGAQNAATASSGTSR